MLSIPVDSSKFSVGLVHPTGNPNVRQAALALEAAELLQQVVTTIAYHPDSQINQVIKSLPRPIQERLISELGRRTWIIADQVAVHRHPAWEVLRMILVKTGMSSRLGLGATGPIDWVYRALDITVAKRHLSTLKAIYAYEDGAATAFSVAKQQGILCLYDLPILYYRMAQAIQQEEVDRFPEFATSLQAVREPAWKLRRKEQEIALADHIFVASSITKQSLLNEGISADRISVIPYGAPTDYFQPQPKQDQQFRALFVGRIGARKGVHYLLQAWQALQPEQAELMLVGVDEFPRGWLSQWTNSVRHVPSVPHFSLNQYYTQANVFVFPSLVEGFGLVLLEAMACGIPVITTPNTAGPDIITDGVEGFIVPVRDVAALQEKLDWCYHHPIELAEMGKAARRKAEALTWDAYRQQLSRKVQELLHQ